jgi:predicted nucleic acid-binding protein
VKTYYDTGVILKLYTQEPESPTARAFVITRGAAVYLTPLHAAEFTSAIRLKAFRGECSPRQAALALAHLEEDFHAGVLSGWPVDWSEAWQKCRALSDAHAGATGCRTLDALHVACALLASASEFVSGDARQLALAERTGLHVINPFAGST